MSALSDRIEAFLKSQLDQTEGSFEFTRNELAARMNCVPSQITYVLSTRFTNSQGYLIESRRGGGGSVVIRRIAWEEPAQFIMHTVNTLSERVSQSQAGVILKNLYHADIINAQAYRLMAGALSNHALAPLAPEDRDLLRARLLGNMLCALLTEDAPEEDS